MLRWVATVLLGFLVLAGAALAGDLMQDSPVEKAMRKDPDRFAARAIDLVAGFGGADGLRMEGIEEYIALKRAGARASALRQLLAMDLDDDGTVDRAELAVSQRAASAATRGRMERQFAATDTDSAGRIAAAEVRAEAQAAGFRALGEAEADVLRSLLSLDFDGDGALQFRELQAALARVGKPD
jgi:Ca2+-binding EF-hand superfamily protein